MDFLIWYGVGQNGIYGIGHGAISRSDDIVPFLVANREKRACQLLCGGNRAHQASMDPAVLISSFR